MTEQSNQQPQAMISVDEMRSAFERHIGNLIIQSLSLEKRIAILETSNAQLQAEVMDLNPLRETMSREAAEIVEGGRAAIRGNEKAAR